MNKPKTIELKDLSVEEVIKIWREYDIDDYESFFDDENNQFDVGAILLHVIHRLDENILTQLLLENQQLKDFYDKEYIGLIGGTIKMNSIKYELKQRVKGMSKEEIAALAELVEEGILDEV